MNPQRRVILQYSVVAGSAIVALASTSKLWASWPAAAFESTNLVGALKALANGEAAIASDSVILDVPAEVVNPAIVAVKVSSDFPDVKSISILTGTNRQPLAARFNVSTQVNSVISTRIRVEGSGNVIALVEAGNGFYVNSAKVGVSAFQCEVPNK